MIKNWYALYTLPRCEKLVDTGLKKRGFETYLALQTVENLWSDRRKKVDTPLISSYVFVKCSKDEFIQVQSVRGVVMFLSDMRQQPIVMNEEVIHRLEYLIKNSDGSLKFTGDSLMEGDCVEIVRGKLKGLIGEFVQENGEYRVGVRLGKWGCVSTCVSKSCVRKI